MLSREIGTVLTIDTVRGNCVELSVEITGSSAKAIAYTDQTGPISAGDRVLLNTTAVRRSLGTGGFHFVMANLTNPAEELNEIPPGHIVKLRYTPVQHTVLSVEEDDSPDRDSVEHFKSLAGMPVVIGQLHSQIAHSLAAVNRSNRSLRTAYIMTDSAALPLEFSRLVAELKDTGLLDKTITVGQAWGGDIEAVNIYSALIAAREVVRADVVVVCPGPGNTGTGTKFGFSSIEQGEIINAVAVLGGLPVAVARISFADQRIRHRGLSHHTITSLETVALCRCILALPMIDQERLLYVQAQIGSTAIECKHKVRILDGRPGVEELAARGISVTSMGRKFNEDPEFFLAASAAGRLAAESVARNF